MEAVFPPGLPAPAGHYSPAIVHRGIVYVSGQLPIRPGQAPDPSLSVERQVALVVENLERILLAAHSGLDRLLSVTLYVRDGIPWEVVNRAYAEALGAHRPARAILPVPSLHHGLAIELQAVAATSD